MNQVARSILAVTLAILMPRVAAAENKQEEGEKLLLHAAQISNIRSADAAPFRLKASFILIGNGAHSEDGSYTEIWASSGRWRRESTLGIFHREEVGSEKKRWILDSTGEFPNKMGQLGLLMQVGDVHLEHLRVAAIRDRNVQGVQARCVELEDNSIAKDTQCIDLQRGVLLRREFSTRGREKKSCEYTDYEQFADRMYPRRIQCMEGEHSGVEVKILELALEPSPDAALFAPPNGAKELANCPNKLQPPRVLQTKNPEYPKGEPQPISPAVISVTVGVDGKPRDLKVVRSIGDRFDDPALMAVSQWVFKPAMCDGDPLPVMVNVEVAFSKW